MKKLASILFIGIILLQSGGIIWWLKAQQWGIQFQISQQLHKQDLPQETILLNPSAFAGLHFKEANEIIYEGKLYDIISTSVEDGKIKLLVYNDIHEENVLFQISHFIKALNANNKKIPSFAGQILALIYLAPIGEELPKSPNISAKNISPYYFVSKTFQTDITSPPPKLFS